MLLAVSLVPAPGRAASLKTLLHFDLTHGANPNGALAIVPSGAALPAGTLIGGASTGGVANRGLIFALTPPASATTPWTLQTLYPLTGQYQLATPIGGITLLSGGGIAGAASGGGPYWSGGLYTITPTTAAGATRSGAGSPPSPFTFEDCVDDFSDLYEVSPSKLPPHVFTICLLEEFGAAKQEAARSTPQLSTPTSLAPIDTGAPTGAPLPDGAGGLYAAFSASSPGSGAVVHLKPPANIKHIWPQTILYVFGQTPGDLATPSGPVISGPHGTLYGATTFGGAHNAGGIYQLTPPAKAGGLWTEAIIWSFGATGDGIHPAGDLLLAPGGIIYGITPAGGTFGSGTVFQLTPPASGQTGWTETLLYNFAGNDGGKGDAAFPEAGLFRDKAGNLYGTTEYGGANLDGAVYKLTKPAAGATAWQETVLWSFTGGADGAVPLGKLVADAKGHLYGTTSLGGRPGAAVTNAIEAGRGYGTIFELIP
jgi:uncharacterized repeat protein (TIGR03803 family)